MKVNDIREQLKKAKLARLRYAEKKAASLGVKVEEYLDE